MDWSKIKTIFILTFLVLDIYLMYEFFKLKEASEFEPIAQASLERQLKSDDITFEVTLPKSNPKDRYLKANPMEFDIEYLEGLKDSKLEGQDITITDGTTLNSILDEPIKISDKFSPSELNAFIKNRVLFGEQYRFWEKSKSENTITYYQEFEDKMFYMNLNGELTFYLNDENEIVTYKQTLLEEIESKEESEKVIQPINAVETLYKSGSLQPKSKITNIELGYFTYVHLSSSQLLRPAWRFVINGEENLFVDAFEGKIIQLGNEEKI
ncbi:regulatory protein YycI of two-component signal transduction system YycFG [Cytobacillus firmus]|uniref:Regulatory protein YycI of two-component signal transduction system YycFG n=2 Tax=Cytobacillus TaxID=2675230 RepID=A0A366JI64_CYTFI|nr:MULTISPECIES: two-component system regulatory protein YycI [Cytobacillus]RBP86731.1 regulatory protein YycI of two-component signal transduction system YycFG [Cytobacillus firmus]TDX43508.1 regulatory protein YycI of two-component signal transduction system YycFG [Cytobacillus oceanisediminis]